MKLTVMLTRIEGPSPPYDHNYLLASTVLAALKNRSAQAAAIIHDNTKTSPYVLSEIHPFPRRNGEFYFCFSTTNVRLAKLVEESFPNEANIRVGPTNFKVGGIKRSEVRASIPSPIEVATLSPVIVREKKNHSRCLIPDDAGYLDVLNDLVAAKIRKFAGPEETCKVLRVVPQAVRRRTVAGGTVLATKGHFFMHGSENGLRFILEHGLGANTAMGFGFVVPTGGW